MSAVLAAILFCTTVIALAGWWSATNRIVFLDAVVEALKTEKFDDPA